MYYTPSDIRERNAFLDSTINEATSYFSSNNGVVSMFGKQFSLARLLDGAVIPNLHDGVIDMPDAETGDDLLPVVAVHALEPVVFGNGFFEQTKTQHEHSITKITLWQPKLGSPDDFVDEMIFNFTQPLDPSEIPVSVPKDSSALTTAPSIIWDLDVSRRNEDFDHIPPARIGRLLLQPVLLLNMDTSSRAQEDLVAHELVHAVQKVENPLRTVASQKQADMLALREELEAYHVGGLTRMRLNGIKSHRDLTTDDIEGSVQIAVEAFRATTNDELDPFRPSPALLNRLRQAGCGNILHSNLEFDQVVARLEGKV